MIATRSAIAGVARRLTDRVIVPDPGLARFRMAGTTVLTLGMSLGVLYVVTQLAGQAFTVALLGVVISMISSMAFNDPDPRQRLATAGLMLVVASAAVTLGALLAPHKVAGDVVFVGIMASATAGRRFGARATSLGMVGFMTYFFALFLGATVSMLPWLIIALAIGTLVSVGMSLLLRERPDRQLQRSFGSLRASLVRLLDVVASELTTGKLDSRGRSQLHDRVAQMSQTVLMVDAQISDVSPDVLPDGIDVHKLSLRLFDVELAAEHLAASWSRVASDGSAELLSTDCRGELASAINALSFELRHDTTPGDSPEAGTIVGQTHASGTNPFAYRMLASAVSDLRRTVARAQTATEDGSPVQQSEESDDDEDLLAAPDEDVLADTEEDTPDGSWAERLSPSSRQAVQVTIATSLAIVAGELLSPARWYWAVIAAFVIYSGTESRGETLTKGRQRIIGTIVGVAIGAVVASFVAGDVAVSIGLIFVSLFIGFYLMKVSYTFMAIGTTTMLALLYGLLGEFSISVLLTRIEETAAGAAIGVATAILVLPTSTSGTVEQNLKSFITGLGDLVERVGERLNGASDEDLTTYARDLDRRLDTLRTSARPYTSGITRQHGRTTARRGLIVLEACDHSARGLARVSGPIPDTALRSEVQRAISRVGENVNALGGLIDHGKGAALHPASALLDTAQGAIDTDSSPLGEQRRLTFALGYLRQIDLSMIELSRVLTDR